MTPAPLKARLQSGETVVGTFCNLGSALAVEAMCLGGLDWILIDLEHGGGTESELAAQLLAAAATNTPSLVRVESLACPRACSTESMRGNITPSAPMSSTRPARG